MADQNGTKPRLLRHYQEKAKPSLREQFDFDSEFRIPTVEKVSINVGVGDAANDRKLLNSVVDELTTITGQRPVVTRARQSIANFNLRQGSPVGASVTLRRERMWEFIDRLVSVAIPRIRDFRGLNTRSFDGRGNYTIGVKEQIIFPEIEYDKVNKVHGMDITVVTTTDKDDEAFALLKAIGFPFKGEVPVVIGQS